MKKYRDISEVRPELCDLRKTGEKWRKTGDRRQGSRRKRGRPEGSPASALKPETA